MAFYPTQILGWERNASQIWGDQNRTIERVFHIPRGLSTVFGQLSTVFLNYCLDESTIYGGLQFLAGRQVTLQGLNVIQKKAQTFHPFAK